MQALDPLDIDLERTTLIEASAGTGKTHTITTLYARLVAVGYSVESILVVTFTEAAAAELKIRIRKRLFGLIDSQGSGKKDELSEFLKSRRDSHLIKERIKNALNCFDQACIMTIHSFCLRILRENAFETGTFFDIELLPDRFSFLRQVCLDFFILGINDLDTLFLKFLNQKGFSPEYLISYFGRAVSKPDIIVLPDSADFRDVSDDYRETGREIHDILSNMRGEIGELILGHKGIDKRSYSKKNVPKWLESSFEKLDRTGTDTLFDMTEKGDSLYKFTRTRLLSKTKPGMSLPEHRFFDLCQHLLFLSDRFEKNLASLKTGFLDFFKKELEKIKSSQGKCFFDDLVNDLAAALGRRDSLKLLNSVRERYKACLIDEFQDTDPGQYFVFSRIFSRKHTPFFMIGDPKQAIYAFRGGDIFAYLKACKDSDQRFTLEKNYRSAPLLVKGVNEIFSIQTDPMLFKDLKFTEVRTPDTAEDRLFDSRGPVPPLQFCFIGRDEKNIDRQGFFKRESILKIIPPAVASDIFSLFNSEKRLNRGNGNFKKITPEDIAVLVRTNEQAEEIQKALSDLNIPSYLSGTGSVFDSGEAVDMYRILSAVYEPDNKGYVKTALCTAVFYFPPEMMAESKSGSDLFSRWQDRFREFKDIWENRGFVPMIMSVFHSEHAFLKEDSHLSERELTNFYHLSELISQAALKRDLSVPYQLRWFKDQFSRDLRDASADELRLESDRESVAVATMHKSKGLEYPVVYLPYLWEGERRTVKKDMVFFHDPDQDHVLKLDIGSRDMERSESFAGNEERAEQRRLLYVALTRASSVCRIFWGGFKSVETSALGSMLHKEGCRYDEIMLRDLEKLCSGSGGSIRKEICDAGLPEESFRNRGRTDKKFSARTARNKVRTSWKISSFSEISLARGKEDGRFKSTDERKQGPDLREKRITLENFPGGAGSGDFFHSVFQDLDFRSDSKEIEKYVQAKLDTFDFEYPGMENCLKSSVNEILGTRLDAGDRAFCLKDIGKDQRFNELEFLFRVEDFQICSIEKIFRKHMRGPKRSGFRERLSKLVPRPFRGFMKGFIDLVINHEGKWYIIDYKSNHLGEEYSHYSGDAVLYAMTEHYYFLQYHLYIVALHRYLGIRIKNYDYNECFGGVFYLFIRGMHPDFGSQYGVFYDRPSRQAVEELSDILDFQGR